MILEWYIVIHWEWYISKEMMPKLSLFFLKVMPFFKNYYYLFIYSWLCWVLASAWGSSPVAASGGHSSSRCAGLSLSRPLLLRSTGSRRAGSAIVAHGPSRSAACGIFPDQGSNPRPPHWQADSQPLRHQGSPPNWVLNGDRMCRELEAFHYYWNLQLEATRGR